MTRRNEHIGDLNRRAAFYTPTYARNALGGETPTWALWATVWTAILPDGGGEVVMADKVTAKKRRKFRVRHQSIDGVNELMVIRYEGEDYDITHIEDDPTQLPKTFKVITAERRKEVISEVIVSPTGPGGGVFNIAYSQKFANVTGTTVTITAGTLPDPGTKDANYFHNMVFVYRGDGNMVRAVYGDGYTVSGAEIMFTQKLRNENVLVHQYGENG